MLENQIIQTLGYSPVVKKKSVWSTVWGINVETCLTQMKLKNKRKLQKKEGACTIFLCNSCLKYIVLFTKIVHVHGKNQKA